MLLSVVKQHLSWEKKSLHLTIKKGDLHMEITEEIFEQLENLVCLFFHFTQIILQTQTGKRKITFATKWSPLFRAEPVLVMGDFVNICTYLHIENIFHLFLFLNLHI